MIREEIQEMIDYCHAQNLKAREAAANGDTWAAAKHADNSQYVLTRVKAFIASVREECTCTC